LKPMVKFELLTSDSMVVLSVGRKTTMTVVYMVSVRV
jgi:hypothetical protein